MSTDSTQNTTSAAFVDGADTSTAIDSADASFQKYQNNRGVKLVNKTGDFLNTIQTDYTQTQSVATSLQPITESEPATFIREGITAFVEGLPGLLKVLDDVAQIHPFISVAVGAFRVALELDLKRRDNDKKIYMLFAEMRDMMAVLVQLNDIDKTQREEKTQQTVQNRMQSLVAKTDKDIRDCANACNTYANKRTIVKVLKSSSWDNKLKGYATTFANRRNEFQFELQMFVGKAVNAANETLAHVEAKIDRFFEYFQKAMSPEEQEIIKLVEQRGGPEAVLKSDKLLREIQDIRAASSKTAPHRAARHRSPDDEFRELQDELKLDADMAIRKNLEQFERKFAIQQREMEAQLERSMHWEADRVIQSFKSGPHQKILHPDIRKIWEENQWRGNVKASRFVLTLRDYFVDKFAREKLGLEPGASAAPTPIEASNKMEVTQDNAWALEYVTITRLQAIIEGFDDDVSGFISISEVNAFTTSCPKEWSFLHWLAYWAIGFQMSMSVYAEKIDTLLAKMFSLQKQVLPANKGYVDFYLFELWQSITELTSAFRRVDRDDKLLARFQTYVDAEESRLRSNLETFKYDIDAMDTLELVMGPGRIEKHVLPLLYLLLQRDFKVMRLGLQHVLHKQELQDSEDTIEWVLDSVYDRHQELAGKQQKLNPDKQFKIFRFELFRYWHETEKHWSITECRKVEIIEKVYQDSEETEPLNLSILNYPLEIIDDLFAAPAFVETDTDMNAESALRAILGQWSGFLAVPDRYPSNTMMTLETHVSPSDPTEFISSGFARDGTTWKLTGSCNVGEDGKTTYDFSRVFGQLFLAEYFRGEVDATGCTLSGSWGRSNTDMPWTFTLKKTTPEAMCFRPPPADLIAATTAETNAEEDRPEEEKATKAQLLWQYARGAILDQVRRTLFSSQWLKERRELRNRYLEYLPRMSDMKPADWQELSSCLQLMTTSDVRFANMLWEARERRILRHRDLPCDACEADTIEGPRIICLDCCGNFTVDFCDKAECYEQEIGVDRRRDLTGAHLPSHNILKVRTTVLAVREYAGLYKNSQETLRSARALFTEPKLEDKHSQSEESNDSNVNNITTSSALQSDKHPEPEESTDANGDNVAASSAPADALPHDESSEEISDGPPRCLVCKKRIVLPCWCCIACEDDVFFCDDCDAKVDVASTAKIEGHEARHPVVKLRFPEQSATTVAEIDLRMRRFEQQMMQKMAVMEKRMEGRMQLLEDLLHRVLRTLDDGRK